MFFEISSVAASATSWHASWRSPGNDCSSEGLKLTNFEARGKRAWILVAHQSLCRRQEADVSGLLPRQESLLHLWQVCAWSYGIRWSLFAWLCFLTCTWWDGGHVSWNMCSQEAGQMFWHTLFLSPSTSGSGLPYPIPPCTSLYPVSARPTWPFQSPQGVRYSDAGILAGTARSWSKNRSLTLSIV